MDEARYWRGLELFNRGAFFDAHEVLEDVWREAPPADRPFLQGVIQVAVALHHHCTGNREGARSVMARGAENLAGYPAVYGGIDVAGLREAIARWQAAVDGSGTAPEIVIR